MGKINVKSIELRIMPFNWHTPTFSHAIPFMHAHRFGPIELRYWVTPTQEEVDWEIRRVESKETSK